MSIGLRIKELRNDLGLNQNDFAMKIGIKQSPLSQMEGGKILPSIETLSTIIREFNISYNWLIDGKGEKQNIHNSLQNEIVRKSVRISDEIKNTKNLTLLNETKENNFHTPKVVTVDKQGRDNVVLVPNKAAAGYLTGYGDTTFIKSLPTYNLPNISNGTFRMFQVAGDSMEPTIQNQSYVVGEWKENWNEDIKDGRVYIFVIQSFEYEGILVKRALNRIDKYGNVLLKSDNRIYGTKTFTPEEIKEVWEVKLYLSFNIPDPATIYDRMNDLEARLIELEQPKKRKN